MKPRLASVDDATTVAELLDAFNREFGELLEINVDGQDVDARRFYERHGYSDTDSGQTEPCLYFHKELGPA